MTARTGACLCGAVTVAGEFEDVVMACHCRQCQTWAGGSPLFTVPAIGEVTVTGADATASYKASTWGERVFCRHCGTTLWWKMQGKPVTAVAPGLFAGQDGLAVTSEIFVDCRAGWMPPWPTATQSTEAQEMTKLDAFLKGQDA